MFKSIILAQFWGPMIRHGATVAGGFLIQQGYADAETGQAITGGLVAAGAVAWSLIEKKIRF